MPINHSERRVTRQLPKVPGRLFGPSHVRTAAQNTEMKPYDHNTVEGAQDGLASNLYIRSI
jgi:hypothetical protein